jgi:carboxyl-terminal processing protease
MKLKSSTLRLLAATAIGFFVLGVQWERHRLRVDWAVPFPRVSVENREAGKPEKVDFSLFWRVWQILNRQYLDKSALNPQVMVFGAISGMVRAVGDPYTAFLPPEQNGRIQEQIGGLFEGVGIQIGYRDDRLAVISPLKGTPAERAGIKAGDKILAVDGEDTAGISLPEAQAKIRGPKGTVVKLTVLHNGESRPVDLKLTRGVILIRSLEWERRGNVVIIRLSRFSEQTPEEWDRARAKILKGGAPGGIILDLRDNPGGLLTSAVYVAAEFIPHGVVTTQEMADGSRKNFRVSRQGKFLKIPVVVLINKGSASASEILAGALRQLAHARLVGEPSFGKGTIQEVEPLPLNTSLHITTGRWLLPNGENLDKQGLTPDFAVKNASESAARDEVLEKGIELLGK